jgi:hypothetical protein
VRRYRVEDRLLPRGSMDPRLNPKCSYTSLNTRLGPNVPKIHETDRDPLYLGDRFGRRRAAGLNKRFLED